MAAATTINQSNRTLEAIWLGNDPRSEDLSVARAYQPYRRLDYFSEKKELLPKRAGKPGVRP
jgi:hypothetical protein